MHCSKINTTNQNNIQGKAAAIISVALFAGAAIYSGITKDYANPYYGLSLTLFAVFYLANLQYQINRYSIIPLVPAALSLLALGNIWVTATIDLAMSTTIGMLISNFVTIDD